MKRLVILLLLFSAVLSQAKPVDSVTARRVAENLWALRAPAALQHRHLANLTEISGFRNVHIFGCDSGFVVVSGSSLVRPVLAYGIGLPFDVNNKPEQLHDWMADYASVIQQMEADNAPQDEAVADEWHSKISGGLKPRKSSLEPLVTTLWNQGSPYNMLCPVDSTVNRRSVAGCVAIAMAQIIKYWNYPIHGIGSNSYHHQHYGNLSADFEHTYYDWDNMPDYDFQTNEQRLATATLVYHCGVSVNMNYSPFESSSYTCQAPDNHPKALSSLVRFFDFQSTIVCRERDAYSDDAWVDLLIHELEANRPILYTGTDPSGGHAFILDGFDDDRMLHINWGWGGGYDGYYAMGAFSPGGGGAGGNSTYTFNGNNSAIMNIIPNGVLKCNPERLSVGRNGGVATTFVSSSMLKNTEWNVDCDAEWLHFSANSGSGLGDTTMVTIYADTNYSGESRSATVVFRQDDEQAVLLVNQTDCGDIETFPYEEGFEDSLLCWTYTCKDKVNSGEIGVFSNTGETHSGSKSFRMGSTNPASNYDQYLISPRLNLPTEATMYFFYQRNYSYPETFEVLLSEGDGSLASFTTQVKETTITKVGWKRMTVKLPQTTRYVAIHYKSEHQRNISIDDISITVPEVEPPAPEGIGQPLPSSVVMYQREGLLSVSGLQSLPVSLYDVRGRLLHSTSKIDEFDFQLPHRGVYLVRIGGYAAQKVVY
ncbi:MAG: C10 family peptidase [Bacteroidales bacterium]|nr:C10 family peptidase [Bacteroidales bacterium]